MRVMATTCGAGQHIGRIQAPAEPDFNHAQIHFGFLECQECAQRGDLEEGQVGSAIHHAIEQIDQ